MSVRKRTWKTLKGEQREAWIVDYIDGQGDRHIETFNRKRDADDYHSTVRVDVGKGVHVAPNKSLTVRETADLWIKRVEADGRERTTVQQYRQHIDIHIIPRLGSLKIAQLTTDTIEKFRDDLLADMSRALARKVLTSLKSILKVAKRSDVAAGVSIKRDKRDKSKIETGRDMPTPAEVKRLVNAAKPGRQLALVLVVATCGLRASELRGLRWADIDLKTGELHVRQRADRYGKIGAPKTETSVRKLPLAREAVAALREWKLRCPLGELAFPTSTGRIEHHANMLRSLEGLQVAAGVVDKEGKAKYGLHAFRHFFASWCLNPREAGGRGLQAIEVQRLLGHSSIVMTMDIYGHLFPRTHDDKELAAASAALLA